MGARLRVQAASTLMAAAAIAVMSWLGLYGFYWTDYDTEAAPAFAALAHGHIVGFLQALPAYGGSLELRAPFALLPGIFGGGELAVYRLVALPCLLASAVLGVWLVSRMRAAGHSRLSRAVALGVCVANPLTLRALEIGHPEELLGAVLCVAAVLVGARGRPICSGVLLGLAIANKQWALLAVGPVLLALPGLGGLDGPRSRAIIVAGAVVLALLLPIVAVHSGAGNPAPLAVTQTGTIFNPEQAFWFLGKPGRVVRGAPVTHRPGFRTPPSWLTGLAHPLIVALAIPLTLLCLRRRRLAGPGPALLLLALLMLLRCLLDPWDAVYYPLPFVLALVAWEATTRRAPPVLSLTASTVVWAIFVWMPDHASADVIAATTTALGLGAVISIVAALLGQPDQRRRVANAAARGWPTRRPAVPW